jgi:hypothetical protein
VLRAIRALALTPDLTARSAKAKNAHERTRRRSEAVSWWYAQNVGRLIGRPDVVESLRAQAEAIAQEEASRGNTERVAAMRRMESTGVGRSRRYQDPLQVDRPQLASVRVIKTVITTSRGACGPQRGEAPWPHRRSLPGTIRLTPVGRGAQFPRAAFANICRIMTYEANNCAPDWQFSRDLELWYPLERTYNVARRRHRSSLRTRGQTAQYVEARAGQRPPTCTGHELSPTPENSHGSRHGNARRARRRKE